MAMTSATAQPGRPASACRFFRQARLGVRHSEFDAALGNDTVAAVRVAHLHRGGASGHGKIRVGGQLGPALRT